MNALATRPRTPQGTTLTSRATAIARISEVLGVLYLFDERLSAENVAIVSMSPLGDYLFQCADNAWILVENPLAPDATDAEEDFTEAIRERWYRDFNFNSDVVVTVWATVAGTHVSQFERLAA